jgi:hypothetical protein
MPFCRFASAYLSKKLWQGVNAMKVLNLYIATFTLIVVHQIDAAYWHEWEMFQLAGGIQVFNIFNLMLIPILLLGFYRVALNQHNGYPYSIFVSILGILVFVIHAGFFIFGFEQFKLPLSVAIIAGCGFFGLWQLYLTIKKRQDFDIKAA